MIQFSFHSLVLRERLEILCNRYAYVNYGSDYWANTS